MSKVIIIAEAGVNHNGDLKLAKKMVGLAKEAGADIIKFQTGIPEEIVSRYAEKAEYQKKNTGNHAGQLEMLKKIMLSYEEFDELYNFCRLSGITFLSTPFDIDSIKFLSDFDMPFWKIPSGEVTNYPYLVKIAQTKKNVVMSTGMCNINEITAAVNVLTENGCPQIQLMHCNTEYPTPYQDVHLKAMQHLNEIFKIPVGYSDHTQGIEIALAAAALGAPIIEKHFTIDKDLEGPDHKASINPQKLKEMITAIRHIEAALEGSCKVVTDSERKNINIARKSIVAKKNIKTGEFFSEDNITAKRPGTGISPMKWEQVIGRKADRDYSIDEMISL